MTRPPLYKMYEEVQMRFTLGQMCSHCSRSPAIVSAAPATRRPRSFSAVDRAAFSHSPDHMPNIMVASVGMKLRVDQPLSLKRNGASRGNNSGTRYRTPTNATVRRP
jgi:hypothetical protein